MAAESETAGGLAPRQFKNESFNEVFQASIESDAAWEDSTSSAFVCSKNTTGYVSTDADERTMPSIEFNAERDGWIIVDFSAAHLWTGTGLLSEDEARRVLHVDQHNPFLYSERLWGHKSTLPPGAWLGITGEGVSDVTGADTGRQLHHDNTLRVTPSGGGTPVDTGLKGRNFPQGKFLNWPVDRYAVRYRVTANGSEVAESGWQYNGNDRTGVYICGCIPVRAGHNIIKTEVAAAMIQDVYGVSQGIRAKDGTGKVKGKFFPTSTLSSRNNMHTLPKSKQIDIDLSQKFGKYKINLGIDVTVHSGNLVVQYRKA